MLTLRFNAQLYSDTAVETAVRTFTDHAEISLERGNTHLEVTIEGANPQLESALAGELGNYALALTVEERRRQ